MNNEFINEMNNENIFDDEIFNDDGSKDDCHCSDHECCHDKEFKGKSKICINALLSYYVDCKVDNCCEKTPKGFICFKNACVKIYSDCPCFVKIFNKCGKPPYTETAIFKKAKVKKCNCITEDATVYLNVVRLSDKRILASIAAFDKEGELIFAFCDKFCGCLKKKRAIKCERKCKKCKEYFISK
ncbi:hypothetical protein PV797_18445 [Clostridiaceae bacterium M8S5]|nr:hypothetical protein PV797_18445 [Clostridiaceae bacterium M8S5]